MREEVLPLFPLKAVLLPHAALPLHIFEERYKTLIGECLKEQSEFGVLLSHEGRTVEVGCTGAVTSVLRRYDDGRLDILVEGRRRFRMVAPASTDRPYQVGVVELLPDLPGAVDDQLVEQTIDLYNQLITIVYGGKGRQLDRTLRTGGIAFVMAQKAGLDLTERQRLLELHSEHERILLLNAYLTDALPRLHRMEEIERIVRSDGYFTHIPPE